MRNCGGCGRPILHDGLCQFCPKPSESRNTSFDPITEMLILHDKIDKMGANLDSINKKIESLAIASLNHSQVFLGVLQAVNELANAIETLANIKNNPN